MDSICDPAVKITVAMMPPQTGKSEILLNSIGYYVEHDPSSIMYCMETLTKSRQFSKTRIAPMLINSPCFANLLTDETKKDGKNTTLYKEFKDGYLVITSATTPSGLSSYPIRVILADEIDRYPDDLKKEGDPLFILNERSNTYFNAVKAYISTPTIKGRSNIEYYYEQSNKQKYYIPCFYCNFKQILAWKNVENKDDPEKIHYLCEKCLKKLTNEQLKKMIRYGEWRPTNKKSKRINGFHINALYSPWVSLSEISIKYIEAKKKGNEGLKTFINLTLCETWENKYVEIDITSIAARVEKTPKSIPKEAAILTCSVDVQGDRLESMVVAWGKDEESWIIEAIKFPGNPVNNNVWIDLDSYLMKVWEHNSGKLLKLSITLIDHGYMSKEVEAFVIPRQSRQIFGIKGKGGQHTAYLSEPNLKKIISNTFSPIILGVHTAKNTFFSKIEIDEPGPGYIHIPDTFTEKDIKELAGSEVKKVKKSGGRIIGEFYQKVSKRNEKLDLYIYNMAAYSLLRLDNEVIESYLNNLNGEKTESSVRHINKPNRLKIHKRKTTYDDY